MAEQQEVSTDMIITNLVGLDNQLSAGIEVSKKNINGLFEIIELLKTSDKQKGEQSATKLAGLEAQINGLQGENTTLKSKLEGLKTINQKVEKLKETVNELIKNNAQTQAELQKESPQEGGYQYKSKSKKSRSKRMLKLNRFGLLKSRSKTKKGKKQLKVKKPMKGRKSVKKGGMKRKSMKKKNKQTKKGKKKHSKRK